MTFEQFQAAYKQGPEGTTGDDLAARATKLLTDDVLDDIRRDVEHDAYMARIAQEDEE